jgi:hypothetical protein
LKTNKLLIIVLFKGCVEVVAWDIVMQTNKELFQKEKYYPLSKKKTVLAAMPTG